MKIGIDISQIAHKGTGVARYVDNMVRAILEYDSENEYTFFFSSLRLSLDADLERQIQKKHTLVKAKLPPKLLDILWNKLHIVPIETFIGKQDIFISSDWTQPPSSAKKVTVVHDLVYLRYPETVHKTILDVQRRRMEHVKNEVDIILADSQATKDDLIELLAIPKENIHVLYPYVDIKQTFGKSTSNQHVPPRKYILSVGKLEPRKNISRLIEAFNKADLKDTDLLIVGPKGWDTSISESKNVKLLGFVPDDELYELYKHAEFFVYPSLYEGFGYPVVEAMALGCPVACSNSSSLAEIGQDSALLFDPKNLTSIKNALIVLAGDKSLRSDLIKHGREEVKNYSSKKFASNLLNYLQPRR